MDFLFTPLGMIFSLIGVIFIIVAASDPIRGIVLMCMYGIATTMITENMAVSGFGTAALFLALVPRMLVERRSLYDTDRRYLRSPVDWMFGSIAILAFIHMIVGIARGNQFRYLGGDFYHIIFEISLPYFAYRVFFRSEERITRFAEITALGIGFIAATLLFLLFTGLIRLIPGSGWEMAHTSFWRFRYSHHFPLQPLIFLVGIVAVGGIRHRLLWFVGAVSALLLTLAVSLKRAAWLALFTVTMPLPFILPPRSRMRLAIFVTVLAFAAGGASLFLPEEYFNPVTQSVVVDRAASMGGGKGEFGNRFEQIEMSFELMVKNPAGYGLGSKLQTLRSHSTHYVHNTFLHYALQAGFPTALLILVIQIRAIIDGFLLYRKLDTSVMRGAVLGSVMALVAMVETGLTEVTVNTFYFTLFVAIIYSARSIHQRRVSEGRESRLATARLGGLARP